MCSVATHSEGGGAGGGDGGAGGGGVMVCSSILDAGGGAGGGGAGDGDARAGGDGVDGNGSAGGDGGAVIALKKTRSVVDFGLLDSPADSSELIVATTVLLSLEVSIQADPTYLRSSISTTRSH